MKLIVITLPDFIQGEAANIRWLLDAGMDLIHLRKPCSTYEQCAALLEEIPQEYHSRIVTHDHFSLCKEFALKGVHLNSRNTIPPEGFMGSVSCSCHSVEEVARRKQIVDYVFLSPVFDSISKKGYHSAFSPQSLTEAARQGIIDHNVIALGGVTASRIGSLREWHFGGAAFLGDIWNRMGTPEIGEYIEKLRSYSL